LILVAVKLLLAALGLFGLPPLAFLFLTPKLLFLALALLFPTLLFLTFGLIVIGRLWRGRHRRRGIWPAPSHAATWDVLCLEHYWHGKKGCCHYHE
jgi:hypothetical protein